MVIKTCKYKKDKNTYKKDKYKKDKDKEDKDKEDNDNCNGKKYKLSGSGHPGKWRQKAYSATTFSQGTKEKLIKGAKYASIVYYPLRRLGKVLTSLPRRAYHATFNKKTKQVNENTGYKLTYKKAYGLKNKSHVKSAIKALTTYDDAQNKLINQYGYKTVGVYDPATQKYEAKNMNIMDRYEYAKTLVNLDSDQHPKIAHNIAKAKLLINFVNKKLRSGDSKSQEILKYIKKHEARNPSQMTTLAGIKRTTGVNFDDNKLTATEKIRQYIRQIEKNEILKT